MLAKRSLLLKKFCEHEALALHISYFGFEMFLCLSYNKNNTKCVVLDKENSAYCLECVLRGAKCNIEGILVSE
jgi:hypothetical protein